MSALFQNFSVPLVHKTLKGKAMSYFQPLYPLYPLSPHNDTDKTWMEICGRPLRVNNELLPENRDLFQVEL